MNTFKKAISGMMAAALLAGCGASSIAAAPSAAASTEAAASSAPADSGTSDGILNIGATDTLGTLNPLNMDWTYINFYSMSMEFLPLIALNSSYNQVGMLAEPITSDDNITFNIKLKDDAVWSDGEPVTTDDVIWTILAMTSPEVANPNFDFSSIKGMGDDNLSPEGATELEGLVKVDDKNMQIVMKSQMGLNTFLNNVGTWILILPKHVLQDIPADELLTSEWFSKPTVVSGPYMVTDYDPAHYISYDANENYFMGAPKIKKMNINIEDGAALVAGLQSGEIDFVNPAMSNIPTEDLDTIESLDTIDVQWADPITNEMTYFNTTKVTDARVRKAIVMALDRETIMQGVLAGHGEVTDGFVAKVSPYYDSSKENIPYDPEGAKALLDEAGWDGSQTIEYYVSSSDTSVIKAAQIMKQELAEVGVNININTVDFATLMSIGGSDEVDMFSVQYTITPSDYYADEASLVSGGAWTGGYQDDTVDELLAGTQTTTDTAELTSLYLQIDQKMEEDVPLFSLYFMSNPGIVSKKLKNAVPSLFGAFNNIQDWEFSE